MDLNLYIEKANVLGIFDIEHLNDFEIKQEVDYASLNPTARSYEYVRREKYMVLGIKRIALPGSLLISTIID